MRKVIVILIYCFIIAGCSTKYQGTIKYNHYDKYFLKEKVYIAIKASEKIAIQLYVLDSVVAKGKRVYSSSRIYSYVNDRQKVMMQVARKSYTFCNCEGEFQEMNRIDSLMLARISKISDSLNWKVDSFLKKINGYNRTK